MTVLPETRGTSLRTLPLDGSRPALAPPIRRFGGWQLSTAIVVIVLIHVIAIRETEFSLVTLVDGREGMMRFLAEAFPPDLNWEATVWPGIKATGITLWVGLLGTTLSIPTSALFAVLAAHTTTPNRFVYQVARAILSFLRAVPDIVFALIFVTAVGLGPFPGVLALILHNTGVMAKLWSEAIEEIDPGPSEALRTVGASRLQIVANATFPQVIPQLVGLVLYRFDVNVRASLVLGLVGAGGIGLLINKAIKSFQFDAMLTHILIVLVLIIAVDLFSAAIRKKLAV